MSPRPRKDYDAAVKLYQFTDLTVTDVARIYGISRQAMWKVLKRRGVTIRPAAGKRVGA